MPRLNRIAILQLATILSFSVLDGCASPNGGPSEQPSLQRFTALSNANFASLPLIRLTGHDQRWFEDIDIHHSATDRWLLYGKDPTQFAGTNDRSLYLAGVTSLTEREAEVLASAKLDGRVIYLPDLVQIDSASASALAQSGARGLHLCGLVELDAACMKQVAGYRAQGNQLLCLDGLTAISPEAVASLVVNKSWGLSLSGLRELTSPMASWMSRLRIASLCLNGVEVVDPEALNQIESWNIKFLYLNGLTDMGPSLVHALMSGSAILRLNGLETIDPPTAAALHGAMTRSWQEVHLEGLVKLSDEAARELAAFGDKLHASEWVYARIAASGK